MCFVSITNRTKQSKNHSVSNNAIMVDFDNNYPSQTICGIKFSHVVRFPFRNDRDFPSDPSD